MPATPDHKIAVRQPVREVSVSREELVLEAIWDHFQGGDWGNALRVITQYGQDKAEET